MEVRGYRWRYWVYFGVMFAVGSQLASLFRHGRFDPADLVVIACLTLFSAVFGSSKGLHLRIVSEVFSGPPRRGFQRVHMRVADIDRQRSAKPGFLDGVVSHRRSDLHRPGHRAQARTTRDLAGTRIDRLRRFTANVSAMIRGVSPKVFGLRVARRAAPTWFASASPRVVARSEASRRGSARNECRTVRVSKPREERSRARKRRSWVP
jgi:hypothetical protein